jgi:hypothetical protein
MRIVLIWAEIFSKNFLDIWIFGEFCRSPVTTKVVLMETYNSAGVFVD